MSEKKVRVSELGLSDSIESDHKSLTDQILADISNHDFQVWNAAYERGYKCGRDYEAKMHSDFVLSITEVQAIKRFALSIGYISYENHEDFHMLLKRLEDI